MPYADKNSPQAIAAKKREKHRHYLEHKERHANDPAYHKRRTLRNWKAFGIKMYDVDATYEIYMLSTNCDICGIEYTGWRTAHAKNHDHDHISGYSRFICCHKCNHHLQKVDNQRMSLLLEVHRHYQVSKFN